MSMNKYIAGIMSCLDTVPSLKKRLVAAFKGIDEIFVEKKNMSTTSVNASGLTFTFYRVDNIVSVSFSGTATETISSGTKIIDIPDAYIFALGDNNQNAPYVNNISGLPNGIFTIYSNNIKTNNNIAVGDKPRGCFCFATHV